MKSLIFNKALWFNILYFIFTALLLIAPALFNRYPLVFSDSGTYINSSLGLVPPPDRPLGYGFFIRIFSWQASLWPVVLAQGLIGSVLIFKTLQLILQRKDVYHFHLPVVMGLLMFSSLAWYAGQIMPDILVSFQILIVFLFVFQKIRFISGLLYLLLFFNFNTTHYSTLLITIVLLVVVAILLLVKAGNTPKVSGLKKVLYLFLVWIASFQFLMLNNLANGNGYLLSQSSNVYLIARLSETGILKSYLDANCARSQIPLCAYKDKLPATAADFIWPDSGPFPQSQLSWPEANKQYGFVVQSIFSKPKYVGRFVWESAKATVKQLFQVQVGEGLSPYREDSAPYLPILSKFGGEINEYKTSMQFRNQLHFEMINLLGYVVLLFSLLAIFLGFRYRLMNEGLRNLMVVSFAGILLNAAITASLANVYSRLQARVTWLIVFIAMIVLIQWLRLLRDTYWKSAENIVVTKIK